MLPLLFQVLVVAVRLAVDEDVGAGDEQEGDKVDETDREGEPPRPVSSRHKYVGQAHAVVAVVAVRCEDIVCVNDLVIPLW
ncbi:MAG: hypothetical protein AAFO91_17130 [Bacteroidota bacterium]